MIGRLNHVAIAVPDLAKAAATYRSVLGAQVSDPLPLPLLFPLPLPFPAVAPTAAITAASAAAASALNPLVISPPLVFLACGAGV